MKFTFAEKSTKTPEFQLEQHYNYEMEKGVLSVLIPCFNEEGTILELIARVLEQDCVGEVIVVDDASTDSSKAKILETTDARLSVIFLKKNSGKGNAIREAIGRATCPFVIIQDADLEYDPCEYSKFLKLLESDRADVVFGSRFLTSEHRRVLYYWHRLGNQILTTFSNMCTGLDLSDMETCYKAMKREVAQSLTLREPRFGFEPEITAKISKLNLRIFEVPISYYGRTYDEGKKIGWKDGVSALRCIIRYNLF